MIARRCPSLMMIPIRSPRRFVAPHRRAMRRAHCAPRCKMRAHTRCKMRVMIVAMMMAPAIAVPILKGELINDPVMAPAHVEPTMPMSQEEKLKVQLEKALDTRTKQEESEPRVSATRREDEVNLMKKLLSALTDRTQDEMLLSNAANSSAVNLGLANEQSQMASLPEVPSYVHLTNTNTGNKTVHVASAQPATVEELSSEPIGDACSGLAKYGAHWRKGTYVTELTCGKVPSCAMETSVAKHQEIEESALTHWEDEQKRLDHLAADIHRASTMFSGLGVVFGNVHPAIGASMDMAALGMDVKANENARENSGFTRHYQRQYYQRQRETVLAFAKQTDDCFASHAKYQQCERKRQRYQIEDGLCQSMNKGFAEVSKLIEDLGGRIDRQGIAMQQSEYLLRTEMAESAIESASTAYDIFLQDARKRKARMSTVDFARVDQKATSSLRVMDPSTVVFNGALKLSAIAVDLAKFIEDELLEYVEVAVSLQSGILVKDTIKFKCIRGTICPNNKEEDKDKKIAKKDSKCDKPDVQDKFVPVPSSLHAALEPRMDLLLSTLQRVAEDVEGVAIMYVEFEVVRAFGDARNKELRDAFLETSSPITATQRKGRTGADYLSDQCDDSLGQHLGLCFPEIEVTPVESVSRSANKRVMSFRYQDPWTQEVHAAVLTKPDGTPQTTHTFESSTFATLLSKQPFAHRKWTTVPVVDNHFTGANMILMDDLDAQLHFSQALKADTATCADKNECVKARELLYPTVSKTRVQGVFNQLKTKLINPNVKAEENVNLALLNKVAALVVNKLSDGASHPSQFSTDWQTWAVPATVDGCKCVKKKWAHFHGKGGNPDYPKLNIDDVLRKEVVAEAIHSGGVPSGRSGPPKHRAHTNSTLWVAAEVNNEKLPGTAWNGCIKLHNVLKDECSWREVFGGGADNAGLQVCMDECDKHSNCFGIQWIPENKGGFWCNTCMFGPTEKDKRYIDRDETLRKWEFKSKVTPGNAEVRTKECWRKPETQNSYCAPTDVAGKGTWCYTDSRSRGPYKKAGGTVAHEVTLIDKCGFDDTGVNPNLKYDPTCPENVCGGSKVPGSKTGSVTDKGGTWDYCRAVNDEDAKRAWRAKFDGDALMPNQKAIQVATGLLPLVHGVATRKTKELIKRLSGDFKDLIQKTRGPKLSTRDMTTDDDKQSFKVLAHEYWTNQCAPAKVVTSLACDGFSCQYGMTVKKNTLCNADNLCDQETCCTVGTLPPTDTAKLKPKLTNPTWFTYESDLNIDLVQFAKKNPLVKGVPWLSVGKELWQAAKDYCEGFEGGDLCTRKQYCPRDGLSPRPDWSCPSWFGHGIDKSQAGHPYVDSFCPHPYTGEKNMAIADKNKVDGDQGMYDDKYESMVPVRDVRDYSDYFQSDGKTPKFELPTNRIIHQYMQFSNPQPAYSCLKGGTLSTGFSPAYYKSQGFKLDKLGFCCSSS